MHVRARTHAYNMQGWSNRMSELGLPFSRFIIPTGLIQQHGKTRRSPSHYWYDETSDEGLARAVGYVGDMVREAVRGGMQADRIILAGSGQVGVVCVSVLLCVRVCVVWMNVNSFSS